METPSDSQYISQESRPRRVAVKFLDDFKRPDEFRLPYEDGAERAFPEDLRKRWNELAEMFPGITLKRAFFTVPPERIQEMIAEARDRNPDYQPPDFFTFLTSTFLPWIWQRN